jgi:predicted Zn-dependent protease
MLGERHIRTILEGALAGCKEASQAEAVLFTDDSALTRFANNTIHQNVAERNSSLRVRAVVGKRIGVASTNSLEAQAIREAAESACAMARFSEENPDFISLPGPSGPVVSIAEAFSEGTAATTPDQRAAAVTTMIRRAEADRLTAAGAYRTECGEVAVANSLGVFAYQASTSADVTLVVMGETSSGYADSAATAAAELDFEAIAGEACGRAVRGANPRELEPGEYEVVLEPYAVAEMLEYLSYCAFGATAMQEGRSFMAERRGQRVADPSITIYDDGRDPRCLPLPFDFEGVPRQRVSLIEAGVARGPVYDSYTAAREGVANTGHALPAPNPGGPEPGHLHLAPGSRSLPGLVASMARGLWVSRFHYVNTIQPLETIITGMTRDGVWLVENGEVRYPVKNLRFSQNVLEALSTVRGIGRDLKLQRGWSGGSLVPALHLASFSFTGKTEF